MAYVVWGTFHSNKKSQEFHDMLWPTHLTSELS